MKKNAIILAAGKSSKFAPFTYEKPKGLFRVKGEILIERQIEQLMEAGVTDICVVVGYMKEKFFYLEQKYGVRIIVNNQFSNKGNLYTLYTARAYLDNTYICCADHYFKDNPFIEDNPFNHSYRACIYHEGKFCEFAVDVSDAEVITNMSVGGSDSFAMVGHAYVNAGFSAKLKAYMEEEIDDFGIASMFWEEYYAKHIRDLTFYKKEFKNDDILEFENIDDLRMFDSEFLLNVDSDIITNICSTLKCHANAIVNIAVINAGLTNVSFSFDVNNIKYVYRHPGGTAYNLIDRNSECFMQMKAKDIGADKSVIRITNEGWKISYFIHNVRECDFEKNPLQLKEAMEYLHKIHELEPDVGLKRFDNVEEGKKLMQIASSTKGNLKKEFADVIKKIDRLSNYVKTDAQKMGYGLVPCHNDVYEPNFLCDANDELYLIDWEYAGLNYGVNDVCCITCRYDWTAEQIEKYFMAYAGHALTEDENRFYWSCHVLCAFYWFSWGLYKGSVGDDDGFFFLPAYRNMITYMDEALERYEGSR